MKKVISILSVLLVLAVLLSACSGEPEPATVPTTQPTTAPTTAPTTEPTTAPTTEPATEPATQPTEPPTEPPRQEGERLTEEELGQFEALFNPVSTPYAKESVNYYGMSLCVNFDAPENLNLLYYFNRGFESEYGTPITGAERDHFVRESGYGADTFGDLYRLPAWQVNGILEYYFGITADAVTGWSHPGWVYDPDTDCYYISPPGALLPGKVDFFDGYYDETEGVLSLYYENRVDPGRVYVVTLRSKEAAGETGYHILSNLPAAE